MQKRTFFEKYFLRLAEKFILKYETLKRVCFFIIAQKPITKLFGPIFTRNTNIIELDLTYACNLNCINCVRSCRQAPSNVGMGVGQIKKFINESIDNNKEWEKIRVMGGEPTLHPDIFEILDLLLEYKRSHSLNTCIEIVTNGYGEKQKDILSKVPKEVKIVDTSKKSEVQEKFFAFNIAPRDLIYYKFVDYSMGCRAISVCGMGLTPFGYYPCPLAGGIDRVFGFDIGRKKMPSLNDSMVDQLKVFCQYCGRFRGMGGWVKKEIMSSAWKKAYSAYKAKRPALSLY